MATSTSGKTPTLASLEAEAAALLALDERRTTPGELWDLPSDRHAQFFMQQCSHRDRQFAAAAPRMMNCIRNLLAALRDRPKVHVHYGQYTWSGDGEEPPKWTAPDGTIVYRSYEDYCND